MGAKVTYATRSEARDVTALLTGVPQNLPEDEATEMTNWDKFISFWERYDALLERRIKEEQNNGNHR